jgi:hypothetical protein
MNLPVSQELNVNSREVVSIETPDLPTPTIAAVIRSSTTSSDLKPVLLAVPHFETLPAPKSNSERVLRDANEHLRENVARKSIRAYEMADRGLKVCLYCVI